MSTTPNPIVFISYAHEGSLQQQVKALADWLTAHQVQAITDHPHTNRPPEKGWRAWMQHNVEDADLVLIVCSERYKNLFEKREVPDDGGRGVSWESGIITDDLYNARLRNRRFFPILPDGGDRQHIPVVLRDWDNNHRFPSGNERILSLIRDEIRIPTPDGPFQQRLPGELGGADDTRLQAREGEVIGRASEVADVLHFLNSTASSAAVCGHVTGSGGIGKTEVCKAALKSWLSQHPMLRAFYIAVSDTADARMLLFHLGDAVGLSPDTLAQTNTLQQLRPHLPGGLYYLDNLEHVAESTGGMALLRELASLPGVRLLASSRVALDSVLGRSIAVDRLDATSASALFAKTWNGRETLDPAEVRTFVDRELGGHPLSITLMARLGRAYAWPKLQERWRQEGTAFVKTRKASERLDSLEISFAITRQLVAQETGALALWQFIALFPEGCREATLEQWEAISGYPDARLSLFEHHILQQDNGWISMLPPVARYALSHVQDNPSGDDATAFCWADTRKTAYQYFMQIALDGAQTASSENATRSRVRCAEEMWAIARLLTADRQSATPDNALPKQLNRLLANTYAFNVLAGLQALTTMQDLLHDGLSSKKLGDLESRLGQIEQARQHYDQAIELYQQEQAKLGLANALKALGDLESRLGQIEQARQHYDQAIELYQQEQAKLGLANALKALGDLESRLGQIEQARQHYDQAIELYQQEQAKLGLANALKALGDLESRLG
ncbi:tetratricopeptide repeat protein, partial [Candidatus Thiothrix sp. Deng01]